MNRSFWVSVVLDTEKPLTRALVEEVCDEIKHNVAHVVDANPAPEDTYAGE